MDVYTLWPVLFDLWLGQYLIDCHCALTHYKELEAITQKKKNKPQRYWFSSDHMVLAANNLT